MSFVCEFKKNDEKINQGRGCENPINRQFAIRMMQPGTAEFC